MPLTAGSRLGPYEITGAIGAGGMGEVYRAHDTKLGRDVAIKILPELFANDPERVARFEREAQLPASLNHPHIAAIYGLEESRATKFLVLEMLTLDQKRETQPLLQAAMNQSNGEVSPDGRWLAYQSDESGQNEVYVRPFPNVNGPRWQISTAGGTQPAWARNGRELFHLDANNLMTTVPVQTSSTFGAGNPVKVLNAAPCVGVPNRTYDVSPDGKRFLMIKDARDTDPRPTTTPASMVVVLNWLEELKARVPAR